MQFLGPPPNGKNFYPNTSVIVHDRVEETGSCGTYPRRSLFILPALGAKFTGVTAPEIFALMKRKEVKHHQSPGGDKDGIPSIGSTALWKNSIFECNT